MTAGGCNRKIRSTLCRSAHTAGHLHSLKAGIVILSETTPILQPLFTNLMQENSQMKNYFFLLTLTMGLLSACGRTEPSQQQIEGAIRQYFQSQLMHDNDNTFDIKDISIHSIKKLGCKEQNNKPGVLCDIDVNIDVTLPHIGKQNQSGVQPIRFILVDGKWKAVEP